MPLAVYGSPGPPSESYGPRDDRPPPERGEEGEDSREETVVRTGRRGRDRGWTTAPPRRREALGGARGR